uniref:Uncharacterized protein n=1 Tax=Siphoviridae sp. cteLh2 TaxID=2825590 RepID=A0A8S5U5U8_9CAUD|nr:hypothetical protein [uncultured Lachnoclostridium sp.]DAF89848.1 MAG TPA: hypothetical protein [Siphoviridae sp. cteLh2]
MEDELYVELYLSDLIKYLSCLKDCNGDIPVYGSFREPLERFSDVINIDTNDEDDIFIEIG